MRASVQKIDSYSWLDDDLYGPQALKLTPPPPASALEIFLQLCILSQPSGSDVKLIICTDPRNCVSVCPLPSVKPSWATRGM